MHSRRSQRLFRLGLQHHGVLESEGKFSLRYLSFGVPAAVVTGMGLIVGLDAATATKAMVAGSLLIVGIADNLTDALSVHIYQEAERLAVKRAFRTTIANFIARLIVSMSFILIYILIPVTTIAIAACVSWGLLLLCGLSYLLAKARHVSAVTEILEHAAVAIVVIAISRTIGLWIGGMLGTV